MEEVIDSKDVLSDIVVFSKYAKYIPELKRRETWVEDCTRTMDMHIKKYPMLEAEIRDVFTRFVFPKKVFPSMRSLQFAGPAIEKNPTRIYNCSYAPIDHPAVFSEALFLLLSGCGFGFSVQFHHIEKLPSIKKPGRSRRYLVSDNIEGWADAVKMLCKAYFYGKSLPDFDFSDIREKGLPLITSGGKAPGPEPLKNLLHSIQMIFERKKEGEQLKSIECHDIICHLAMGVMSGGIRRASCISIFSVDDEDMLSCKFGNWHETNPQRCMANNTALLLRHRITQDDFLNLWEKVKNSGSGEPGIYFSNNSDYGFNPCCFTGDMKLKTEDGYIELKNLVNKKFKAFNYNDELVDCVVWSNGKKTVCELQLHKRTIRCTPDHVFKLENGQDCLAKDLAGRFLMSEGLSEEVFDVVDIEEQEEVFDFSLEGNSFWGYIEKVVAHNCEISLKPNSFCNLSEINVSNITCQSDLNERAKAAAFIGSLQAGYTNFHYLRDVWKKTTEKEALLGCSQTGIASNEYKKCDVKEAALLTIEENKRVAKIIGINEAKRICAIKPSGTTSLCAGTSSGIHAWFSEYYIRRMKLQKSDVLYHYLKKTLPELIEDCVYKPKTDAFVFIPIKAPKGATTSDNEPALELLERIKFYSKNWIKPGHISGDNSHNVSATVYIDKHEWDSVAEWMWNNREHYNGLSVLPKSGHTYVQTPFEKITKERYEELIKYVKNIDLTQVIEEENKTDLKSESACSGGLCELTY